MVSGGGKNMKEEGFGRKKILKAGEGQKVFETKEKIFHPQRRVLYSDLARLFNDWLDAKE